MMIRKTSLSVGLITISITLVFLLSSLFFYYSMKEGLKREILSSSLPLLSENIYSDIQHRLSLPLNVSSSMSRDTFLTNWVLDGEKDIDEVTLYLRHLKDKYGFFSTFFVSESTGRYYYFDGVLKEVSPDDSHDVWYYAFVDSGRPVDLDVDTDEASNGILSIFINNRLEDLQGNLLGVVGVGIRLETVARLLQEKKDQYHRNVYLVDENGVIQVHSDISLVEQVDIYMQSGISDIADELMREDNDHPMEMSYLSSQGRVYITSRYIPELEWHVFVEQNERTGLKEARKSLFISLFFTLLISAGIFLFSSYALKSFEVRMENLAGTDTLTGVSNRRELFKQYEIFQYRTRRFSSKLSVILLDLDKFKNINDRYGHLEGDRVLKESAVLFSKMIRPSDLIVRWGGDEFLIMVEASESEAVSTAERILEAARSIRFGGDRESSSSLTLSIGVCEAESDESLEDLTFRADQAMYLSKQKGRNRVTPFSECSPV